MKILCVFRSGRIIDRTVVGEHRIALLAEEFPTLIYFFNQE